MYHTHLLRLRSTALLFTALTAMSGCADIEQAYDGVMGEEGEKPTKKVMVKFSKEMNNGHN